MAVDTQRQNDFRYKWSPISGGYYVVRVADGRIIGTVKRVDVELWRATHWEKGGKTLFVTRHDAAIFLMRVANGVYNA